MATFVELSSADCVVAVAEPRHVAAVHVMLVFAVTVVKVAAAGVVPPITPGLGKEDVEPPNATEVPAMVMEEFDSMALATLEQVPTAPAEIDVTT